MLPGNYRGNIMYRYYLHNTFVCRYSAEKVALFFGALNQDGNGWRMPGGSYLTFQEYAGGPEYIVMHSMQRH